MKIQKIWHNYKLWEDWKNGMYEKRLDIEYVEQAKNLLENENLLLENMENVTVLWTYSTEENLTNTEINRKAWLGQASCSLYCGATKIETCSAWSEMNDEDRIKANEVAKQVIYYWENKHTEELCQSEKSELLF